jgi:hypothetical protein
MYDLCEIDEDSKKFFEFYKNSLNDIFEELYKLIECPKCDSNNYIDILYEKLQMIKQIRLNNYDLICFIKINYIYLKNEKQNLSLEIIYFKKINLQKNNILEEIWVCNDDIAMLICNQDNYIYYLAPKFFVESLDEEKSIISVISELSELNYAIKNDLTIYSSNTPYFKVSDLKKEFGKKLENLNMQYYLTGVNASNFPPELIPKKIKFLRGNIRFDSILKKNINKFQYYLYNEKIGLTFEILRVMDLFIIENNPKKICYINIDYILIESSKIKLEKYLAFYLSKLFSDYNTFESFYNKLKEKVYKKKCSRIRLIYKIVKYIIKNYNNLTDNLFIIFDNIYTKKIFYELDDTFKKLEEKLKPKNIFFCFCVGLNKNNLDYLKINKINDNEYNFKFINNDNRIRPDEYRQTSDNDCFFKTNTIESMKKDIELILKNKNKIEILNLLLRIKYIPVLLRKYSDYKDIEIILENFIQYFHLTCSSSKGITIKKIEFKNDIIKEYFNEKFNSIICDIVNSNDMKIFEHLINSCVEGVLLEKQIILNLISSIIFKKLKIDKIYCLSNLPNNFKFNFGDKVIIIQLLDNAPMYDFGVITYFKNELILKIYQVGINKENSALKKLNEDFIIFDLEYFLKKIKSEYGIDIKKYTFGIITSKSGYDYNILNKNNENEDNNDKMNNIFYDFDDEDNTNNGENLNKKYKNYKNMKKFCEENKYEFIIFDKDLKNSFIQKNETLAYFDFINETEEKNIKNTSQIYDNCDITKLKKNRVNKNDYITNNEIKALLKFNFDIKYISKFKTINDEIPNINRKNFYLLFRDSNKNLCIKDDKGNILKNSGVSNKLNEFKSEAFIGCIILKKVKENIMEIKNDLLNKKRKSDD